jgi:hypothetical protein
MIVLLDNESTQNIIPKVCCIDVMVREGVGVLVLPIMDMRAVDVEVTTAVVGGKIEGVDVGGAGGVKRKVDMSPSRIRTPIMIRTAYLLDPLKMRRILFRTFNELTNIHSIAEMLTYPAPIPR